MKLFDEHQKANGLSMGNRKPFGILLVLLTLTLFACEAAPEPVIELTPSATATDAPAPTSTPPPPTRTAEAQIFIDAATLFSADFENGYPDGIVDASGKWHLTEEEGGTIFCNEVSDHWRNLQFGSDDWTNYAVSLRVKFLSSNGDQSAETYIRINQSTEGYRAGIATNGFAGIGVHPPYIALGGSHFDIQQGEWILVELRAAGNLIEYYLNDELIARANDNTRGSGHAGFGTAPDAQVCVDDILVWEIYIPGNPD